MVKCAGCGNNCCNGTEQCPSCSEAYEHQNIYYNNPTSINFAHIYYHKHWIKQIINPIITKFGWILVSNFNKDDKFVGFEFKKYPEHCKEPFVVWFKIRF
jgi:hypothetical protein